MGAPCAAWLRRLGYRKGHVSLCCTCFAFGVTDGRCVLEIIFMVLRTCLLEVRTVRLGQMLAGALIRNCQHIGARSFARYPGVYLKTRQQHLLVCSFLSKLRDIIMILSGESCLSYDITLSFSLRPRYQVSRETFTMHHRRGSLEKKKFLRGVVVFSPCLFWGGDTCYQAPPRVRDRI